MPTPSTLGEDFILDTFTGTGTLATHTGEVGATWSADLDGETTLAEMIVGGGVVTTPAPTINNAFYVTGKPIGTADCAYEIELSFSETEDSNWFQCDIFHQYNVDDVLFGVSAYILKYDEGVWSTGLAVDNPDGGLLYGHDTSDSLAYVANEFVTLRLELLENYTRAVVYLNGALVQDSGTLGTPMGEAALCGIYPYSGSSTVPASISRYQGAYASPAVPSPTYGVGLPSITAPDGTPVFLAEGHGIDEDSLYAQVPMTTGHSRTRKRYTVTDRVVTVRWFLDSGLPPVVNDWYENTLLAGTRAWSARVRNQGAGPAMLWWRARWIDYQMEMLHLGRGLVSGRLLLTGEGQVDGPETGALAMEVSVALLDIRSSVAVQAHLAMEILVALLQPLELAMEILVELLPVYFVDGARITEDDHARVTEDGDPRVIEDGTAPAPPPAPPPSDVLAHFDGADGSTTFTEENGKTFTLTGSGIALSTAQSKFGSASVAGFGSGKTLRVPHSTISGDFTLAVWFYWDGTTGGNHGILTMAADTELYLRSGSSYAFTVYSSGTTRVIGSIPSANAWHLACLERVGSTICLTLDGVSQGTYTDSSTFSAANLYVGSYNDGSETWAGYLDDVYLSIGTAVFGGGAFTPPASAFT